MSNIKQPEETMSAYKARLVVQHIRSQLAARNAAEPLIVGFQGPQGSGKSTLAEHVQEALRAPSGQAPLSVACLSLDDLYLTHADQVALAQSQNGNKLLSGRGQPGTHDIPLGTSILERIRSINSSSNGASSIDLPTYDKSQFGGEGDRAAAVVCVEPKLDVLIWEGWCLGFGPLADTELEQIYTKSKAEDQQAYFLQHDLAHLQDLNDRLAVYAKQWWTQIDCFIKLEPTTAGAGGVASLETVFQWRVQAEWAMKAKNGGKGMSDDDVRAFVARYMPTYELFSRYVESPEAPWTGKGLKVGLDIKRDVTGVDNF